MIKPPIPTSLPVKTRKRVERFSARVTPPGVGLAGGVGVGVQAGHGLGLGVGVQAGHGVSDGVGVGVQAGHGDGVGAPS